LEGESLSWTAEAGGRPGAHGCGNWEMSLGGDGWVGVWAGIVIVFGGWRLHFFFFFFFVLFTYALVNSNGNMRRGFGYVGGFDFEMWC
jgi:hypothetical protein